MHESAKTNRSIKVAFHMTAAIAEEKVQQTL